MLSDSCIEFVVLTSNAAGRFLDQVAALASELHTEGEHYSGPDFNYGPEVGVLKKAAEELSTECDVDLCVLVLKFAKWFDRLQAGIPDLDNQRLQTEMKHFCKLVHDRLDAKPIHDPTRAMEWTPEHVRTFHHLWSAHVAAQPLMNSAASFYINEAISSVTAGGPFKFHWQEYWDRTENFVQRLSESTETGKGK